MIDYDSDTSVELSEGCEELAIPCRVLSSPPYSTDKPPMFPLLVRVCKAPFQSPSVMFAGEDDPPY